MEEGSRVSIFITDTKTGETREYKEGVGRAWASECYWNNLNEFNWVENNCSCDCVRYQRFFWCTGEDEPEIYDEEGERVWGIPCGHERFIIRVVDEKGVELYSEHEEAAAA